MGNFRSDNKGFGRNNFGGRSGGFRGGRDRDRKGGFRDRNSGGFERRRPEMHEATCAKCGEQCAVPFKPTGEKPVYCSSCFKKEEPSNNRNNSNYFSEKSSSAKDSQEQLNQINKKLDKILGILEELEVEEDIVEDDEEE